MPGVGGAVLSGGLHSPRSRREHSSVPWRLNITAWCWCICCPFSHVPPSSHLMVSSIIKSSTIFSQTSKHMAKPTPPPTPPTRLLPFPAHPADSHNSLTPFIVIPFLPEWTDFAPSTLRWVGGVGVSLDGECWLADRPRGVTSLERDTYMVVTAIRLKGERRWQAAEVRRKQQERQIGNRDCCWR